MIVPSVRRFDRMFNDNAFPPVADPQRFAEDAADRHFHEVMDEMVGEDGPERDEGDVADDANQVGLAVYETMFAMHHATLNLFTAGLFHLSEQQIASLFREWTGTPVRRDVFNTVGAWLRDEVGIDITAYPARARLRELELVANVIKHAEGRSADDLRAINPDYFREPILRATAFAGIPNAARPVAGPLMGQDIYVTKDDYDRFVEAVIQLWAQLADELDARRG